ncbi:hypothetical protein FQA47_019796 [Oryzias melastigma]|uniref:Uncharacterized protein n=1 Tax=Oryzias melastigma TaxID=30732 RepID=A0A834BSJ8_ORYME|nr:hypothetical protein FQA47_019796 [Oryzias melastigma]
MKRGTRDEAAVTHSCAAAASARDVREISGMGEGGDVTAGSSPLKVVGARGAQTRRRTQPASTPRAQALLSSPAPAAPPGWSRRASPAARGSEPARLPAPSAPGRGVLPAPPPAAVRPVTPNRTLLRQQAEARDDPPVLTGLRRVQNCDVHGEVLT